MGKDEADLHSLLLGLHRSVGLLHTLDAGPVGEVSASELFALHELDAGEDLSQQDLAHRLRLDKSTVSRLLAGLERQGLVARHRDPHNRRLVRLSLTAAGKRLHRHLADEMHAHQQMVLSSMTASERAALRTGLAGLLRALADHTTGTGEGAPRPVVLRSHAH